MNRPCDVRSGESSPKRDRPQWGMYVPIPHSELNLLDDVPNNNCFFFKNLFPMIVDKVD